MNIKTLTALGIACVLALSSCGGRKNPLDKLADYSDSMTKAEDAANNAPPVAITYAQLFDKSHENKNITVEGYVSLPSVSYTSGGTEQLDLNERKGMFGSPKNITINVTVGQGKNSMVELDSGFQEEDLKITLDDGKMAGFDSHVRITGKLTDYGTIDVAKIEDAGNTPVDYSKLDVTAIDASHPGSAALQDKLVSAEGTLDIPMTTLGGDYTWLYLHVKGLSDPMTVDVQYGNDPNHMETLPDNYGEDDLKVHANDGTLVGNKKVRVYGVYDDDAIKVEYVQIL